MAFLDEICNVCLKKCENFKAIDENTKSAFDILLPKIDFTVIQGQATCKNCADVLTKCLDFKENCLHTNNYIILFVNKNNVKLDLRDVYLSKNETDTDIAEDEDICGLCLCLVKNCSTTSLDVKVVDITLTKMIEQCLPELDLSIIKKPVVCASCRESLGNCFHFVMNCLNADERINKYYDETSDINSKGQKELNNLSQFRIMDVTTSELYGKSADIIKVESFCEDRENPAARTIDEGGDLVKLEQMGFGHSEGANEDIANKHKSFMEFADQKVNDEQGFTPNNMWACAEESNKLGSIKIELFCEESETKHKEEDLDEKEEQKLFIDEIEIKTDEHDFNRFVGGIVSPQSEVSTKLERGEKRLMANIKGNLTELYLKHAFNNKSNVQLSSEMNMYNCGSCSYRTNNKYLLKSHSLVHKDPSEVTMFKCDYCSCQMKRKYHFKKHLLTHKHPSEVAMYKCDSCSFQTKHKENLTLHFLTHKDPSEVKMYKCVSCSFQTKYKSSLKKHLLQHKDTSEVTMFKCDACSYQNKCKGNLNRHLLTHKDRSEVKMYKCGSCSFQTKYESSLKKHSLKHKDPSEVTMYKCVSCSFHTKCKSVLKKHSLNHKDPLEVTMYKCNSCSYQTKHKYYLKSHLLIHKDASEVTMYKCDSCSYRAKRKDDLKKHLRLIHSNSWK